MRLSRSTQRLRAPARLERPRRQGERGRRRSPPRQLHPVRRGRCIRRVSCTRCAPRLREPAGPPRTTPPHTHPQLLLAVLGPHPPPRPARRHRDPRRYPSGQPGEDAASIAAVAPTREVADGDALPPGRRGACARKSDSRSPPTPSPMRRAGSTASWVTRGVLFGHSRTSAALLDGETVVDGSLTSVGGGGGTRRATPAADLGVARRPGRSHATRGGCSELGEQKSRPFRTILMIRDCRGAPCSQLRW